MSQAGKFLSSTPAPGTVLTLTGNTGGPVSPDGSGNINVEGDSSTILIAGNPGTHTLTASLTPFIRDVSTTPYTVVAIDFFLAVDATAGSITINMPNTTTTGRLFVVKDWKGQANIHNIIITTPGATALFDGFTAYTMNAQYQSVNLIFDGTNYQLW